MTYSKDDIRYGDFIIIDVKRYKDVMLRVVNADEESIYFWDEVSKSEKRTSYESIEILINKERAPEYYL